MINYVLLNLENAFCDKGAMNGADVIMTDNCDELKDALHTVWTKSRLLLCIFHLMQQVWKQRLFLR